MTATLASESAFRRMTETIFAASSADDTYVSFGDSEDTTLRFANNQVVQHVSVRSPSITIRVAFGKRAGSTRTNRLDDASLRDAVKRAEAVARLAPEDPEYLPPVGPQRYPDLPTYRRSTASMTPMDLARRTRPVVDECMNKDLLGAGIMTRSVAARGVATTTGLFGYEQSTEAEFSLTATADDSSGWSYNAHRDINALEVSARTRRAVEKAAMSRAPREVPAGHYPVILEPAAVAGVIGPLFGGLSARNYFRGNSPFVERLNSTVLDSRLSVRSDPGQRDLLGSRFGEGGLAARPQTWIENGVLKQLHYDRFTAMEHNVEPTAGTGAPVVSFGGPTARSIEELIETSDRAILITNFWYIRSVDPTDLTITGMTRDGTFLVENGRIVCGLKNFRFHDSPLRCFLNVDAATEPLQAITLERGKMLLPAMRLPSFHLSSVTRF